MPAETWWVALIEALIVINLVMAAFAYTGGSFSDKRHFAATAVLVTHPQGDFLIDRHPDFDAINVSRSLQDPFNALIRHVWTGTWAPKGSNWGHFSNPEIEKTRSHRPIGQCLDGRRIEFTDNVLRRALWYPKPIPERGNKPF